MLPEVVNVHGIEAPTGAQILHLSANTGSRYTVLKISKLSYSGSSTTSAMGFALSAKSDPGEIHHRNQPPFGQNLLKTVLWSSDLKVVYFLKKLFSHNCFGSHTCFFIRRRGMSALTFVTNTEIHCPAAQGYVLTSQGT